MQRIPQASRLQKIESILTRCGRAKATNASESMYVQAEAGAYRVSGAPLPSLPHQASGA